MPVRVQCPGCDSFYRLPDHLGGKTVRCKGCGETFKVPFAVEETVVVEEAVDAEQTEESTLQSTAPAKKAAVKPRDDDELEDQPENEAVFAQEEQEEEVEKPKRRGKPAKAKGGSKKLLIVAVGVLLLVAILAGGAWWFFRESGGTTKVAQPLPKQPNQPAPGQAPMIAPNKGPKGVLKDEPLPTENVSYKEHVKPFLERYCVNCHGGKQTKAGVDLASFEAIMGGGEDKLPLVVPEDPDKSLIVLNIEHKGKHKMPPPKEKQQPNNAQKNMLRTWVKEGAKDDSMKDGIPLGNDDVELLAGTRSDVFYRSRWYSSVSSMVSPTSSSMSVGSITPRSPPTSMR
jgi:predicted Zn finger-like uncharacterized protein